MPCASRWGSLCTSTPRWSCQPVRGTIQRALQTCSLKAMAAVRREHTVAEGLHEVALWNSAQLVGSDLAEAFAALQERRPPQYSKL